MPRPRVMYLRAPVGAGRDEVPRGEGFFLALVGCYGCF